MTDVCTPQRKEGSRFFERERELIWLITAFVVAGVFFMLVPGTFLGVWNLVEIGRHADNTAAQNLWIQAHGHAQLFGWLGTFILGIGFYNIPNLRRVASGCFFEGWLCWFFWVCGVSMRWWAAVTQVNWQILMFGSAVFELLAVALFTWITMVGSKSKKSSVKMEPWALLVITGSIVWLLVMIVNLEIVLRLIGSGDSPLIPDASGKRFLFACVWGWIVPVVWGLSARWLPPLLGLLDSRETYLIYPVYLNIAAICLYGAGIPVFGELLLLLSTLSFLFGLRLFEKPQSFRCISAVHTTFADFVRVAYCWAAVSACLFLVAGMLPCAQGVAGAARHAITVGFFSTMVFTIGPKVLPVFLGRKRIASVALMFAAQLVLVAGCALRVTAQILAYDCGIPFAWSLLPVSACIELLAVTLFSLNMLATLWQKPAIDEIIAVTAG